MGTPYKKKWLAVIPPAKIIKICGWGYRLLSVQELSTGDGNGNMNNQRMTTQFLVIGYNWTGLPNRLLPGETPCSKHAC
jgi:hypothetical protein